MWKTILLIVATASVAACGGGGGNNRLGPVANAAPTISSVGVQQIDGNGQGQTSTTVNDDQTDANDLRVTVSSSDQALLPDDGIVVAASGRNRTIDLIPVPDEIGRVQITITVADQANLTASTQFEVNVVEVSQSVQRFVRNNFRADAFGDAVLINVFAFENDAEDDDFADLLI